MQIFHRHNFTEIWLTLQSNETLGVLDSSYLEDYFGNDGQLTLHDVANDVRVPVPMSEVIPDPTPDRAHDAFTGFLSLVNMSDGNYRVEGRVRDVVGNYTILSEVQSPIGDEQVLPFDLRITSTEVTVNFPATVNIQMGMTFSAHLPNIEVNIPVTLRKSAVFLPEIRKSGVLITSLLQYQTLEVVIKKGFPFDVTINKDCAFDVQLDPDGAI